MDNVVKIEKDGKLYAIVIKNNFVAEGIHFFTNDSDTQQVAYMQHNKGHVILNHYHNEVKREVLFTKEVLVMKNGTLKCLFFDEEQCLIEALNIEKGDVLILINGGHGFECISDVEMFEIKQGPYVGNNDKTRF